MAYDPHQEAIMRELSGGLGGRGLGNDDLGDALGEMLGDVGLGHRMAQNVRARVAHRGRHGGMPQQDLHEIVREEMRKYQSSGYGLLNPDVKGEGAFDRSGSLSLVVFSGTIAANTTMTGITGFCDRLCTIRELKATLQSGDLLIQDLKAGGLPYLGLQFPISVENFTVRALDRKVQAGTFNANTRFVISLQNPTGQQITYQLEFLGSAANA